MTHSVASFTNDARTPWTGALLAGVLILVPLLQLYDLGMTLIGDERARRQREVERRLSAEAVRLARETSPATQLSRLIARLIRGTSEPNGETLLLTTLQRLDRRYPGAFRWVRFDANWVYQPLSAELEPPGGRAWAKAVPVFRNHYRDAQPLTANTNVRMLAYLCGGRNLARDLVLRPGTIVRSTLATEPIGLLWRPVGQHSGRAVDRRAPIRGGLLVMVFPQRLPPQTWARLALQRNARRPSSVGGAAIDYQRPAENALDPRLSWSPLARYTLADEYLQRSDTVFTVKTGRWLAAAATPDDTETIRTLALYPQARLDRFVDTWQVRLLRALAALGLAMGLGTWLLASGRVAPPSLHWRIAALFGCAAILPVLFLSLSGSHRIASASESQELQARERLRSSLAALTRRLQMSQETHERRLLDQISALVPRPAADLEGAFRGLLPLVYPLLASHPQLFAAPQLTDVLRLGERLNRDNPNVEGARRLVTRFHIGDAEGNVRFSSERHQDDKSNIGIRMVLRQFLWDEGRRSARKDTFLDGMFDEMTQELARVGAGGDATAIKANRMGRFGSGPDAPWLMTVLVKTRAMSYPVLIDVSPRLMGRTFARRETVAYNSEKRDPGIRLHFIPRTGAPRINLSSTVPAALQEAVQERLHADPTATRFELTLTCNSEPWLCLVEVIPGLDALYVPCLAMSMAPVQRSIGALRAQLAWQIGGMTTIAVLLGLLLASQLVRPIRLLDEAAQRIAGNDLTVTLPDLGADEIGRLGQTFNQMVQGLRERLRMQAYVSESVIEAVRDDTTDSGNRGEIREATVLFSDIRGFTTLSESHPPPAIFAMLNGFLGGIEPLIKRHRGRIDKFIGDAVMAVFLAEDGTDDHPLRAVRAAWAMRRFLDLFNRKRERAGEFTIKIGVGINTGNVMMGDVGSRRRKDLTVIGDVVNVAARLEGASKEGRHTQIVVSEQTRARAGHAVQFEEMAAMPLKGKTQPIRLFEVVTVSSAPPSACDTRPTDPRSS